jgi:transcriptional regulator with XRE-family HTH domain
MSDLNTRILRWLSYTGRTQREMAAALGVSDATVSHWTTGVHGPATDKLTAIAAYFGVTLSHFFAFLPDEEG